MQVNDHDWQLFHSYPRLVDYLMETTSNMQTTKCVRLKLYLKFAKIVLAMCDAIQALEKPSDFPRPKSTSQYDYQEQQVAELIATHDPDFGGMILGLHSQRSKN